MYDENNFIDCAPEMGNGSVLGGMVAAMERFREYERGLYNCVDIAMECLSKKNFSGSAVEYCGRVLGTPSPSHILSFSRVFGFVSRQC